MRIAKFEVNRIAKCEIIRIAKRIIERVAKLEIIKHAKYQIIRLAKRMVSRIPKYDVANRIAKRAVERLAKGIDPNSVVKKFLPLIQWASNKFSKHYQHTQYNYQDFYDAGVETLAYVLEKKSFKFATQIEFGKYFKTSLYRNLRRIQRKAYAKKRMGITIQDENGNAQHLLHVFSIDNGVKNKHGQTRDFEIPDKGDLDYSFVAEDCKRLLNGIEKTIFEYLVDPPEDFTSYVLRIKSRKDKIALIEGLPIREAKLNHRCLCGYFEARGVPEHIYRLAYNKVKKVVKSYVRGE